MTPMKSTSVKGNLKENKRCCLAMRRLREERRRLSGEEKKRPGRKPLSGEEKKKRDERRRFKDAERKRKKRDLFAKAYDQQRRLLNLDSRVLRLRQQYQNHAECTSASYLRSISRFACHTLERAKPARNWHGDCCTDTSREEADYFLFTQAGHNAWLRDGNGMQLVVVRDQRYNETRQNRTSIKAWWDDMLRLDETASNNLDLDFQDFSERQPKTGKIRVSAAHQYWKKPEGELSDSNRPLNLLNLDAKPGSQLEGITQHMTFLDDVLFDADVKMAGPGKKHSSGIKGCVHLRILGQSRSASGWHRDNMGVFTYVTLEDSDRESNNATTQGDERVVKLWAVARIDHLTKDEQNDALADFAKEGELWVPKDPVRVVVIALVRGDTLIMPPGCIHGPITLTDCLFSGGMCMHKKFIPETMAVWSYLVDNPHCTNEDPPQQAKEVVSCILDRVLRDPEAHGILNDDALEDFKKNCSNVIGPEPKRKKRLRGGGKSRRITTLLGGREHFKRGRT